MPMTERREIKVAVKSASKRAVTIPIPTPVDGDRQRLEAMFEEVRIRGDKIDAALEALRKRVG